MPPSSRSVDNAVGVLRKKLEKHSPRWRYLHSHFGVGYAFRAQYVDWDGPREEMDLNGAFRLSPHI
jgi:hypothetical protein